MIPFYYIFALLAIASFSEALGLDQKKRLFILLIIGYCLSVFAGLRFQPGAQDYEEYVKAYIDISENGLSRNLYKSSALIFEPGFLFLYYLASLISDLPCFGLLVIAVFSVSLNLFCYYKYSPQIFIFAVLFYYVHTYILRDMSLIRSGVAAAICLYSLRFVKENRLISFCLSIMVAMSFHMASAVYFIVYPIYKLNISRRNWSIIVIISFLIAYIMPLGRLILALPKVGPLARAVNYSWMIGNSSLGILSNPTILKQLFFVTISLIYYNRLCKEYPYFKLLLTSYILSVCWLLVWNDFAIISGRMATFLSITEVLIIPSTLFLVTRRSRPFFAIILILLAFVILYMNGNFYLRDVPGVLPYKFVLFN